METLNTTPVSQAERVAVAPVAVPRPQTAAHPALPEDAGSAQPDYTVEISSQARVAADTHANATSAPELKSQEKNPAPKAESKAPVVESNYAQFMVAKNNRVVMKLLKQTDHNVIKEVPSRDDRHIRDTVARLLDNDGNLLTPER
ncbi:MAG: hypothetical protein HQK86_03555 [Nitrospinae bacterium]|nr:hypothetical protein [Nitrospinota bacterium]MBF0633347.1 hypothetical protein [Nitrospinota bacterium]